MAGSVSGLNFLGIKEADSSLELPSWIPDFSALNSEISLMVAYNIRSSASDSLDPRSFHIDKKKLSVLGVFGGKVLRNEPFSLFHLGTIMELLEGIPETSDIWKPPVGTGWEVGDVDDVPGIHKTAKRGWTLTHQRRYETLWRTLVSDSFDGEQPALMTCEKSMDLMIQSFVTRHLLGATMSLARNQEELDFLLGRFKPSKLEIHKSLDGYNPSKIYLKESYTAQQILFGYVRSSTRDLGFPPHFQLCEHIRNTHGVKSQEFLGVLAHICHQAQNIFNAQQLKVHKLFKRQLREMNNAPRALFTTDRGHLGHAKANVHKDDEIWVLAGASIPFILRPVDEATYHLVSDAYVHGIMYGEGVTDESSDSRREISLI
jgi:hypothetical protein